MITLRKCQFEGKYCEEGVHIFFIRAQSQQKKNQECYKYLSKTKGRQYTSNPPPPKTVTTYCNTVVRASKHPVKKLQRFIIFATEFSNIKV